MENKTKSISSMITALETRNELLHEEIKRNEEQLLKLKKEFILQEDKTIELSKKDNNVEMVA